MIQSYSSEPIVLLAEDSEDDAFFFQRAFKKANVGCTLVHAGNGKLAIELLSQRADASSDLPFLFFLDLKMPVTNGFEVLEWLKTAPFNFKLKVIVLSGSNDYADRERAARLGAAGYLVKPIAADVLREIVQRELAVPRDLEAELGATV